MNHILNYGARARQAGIPFLNLSGETIPAYCPVVSYEPEFSADDGTIVDGRLVWPVYGSVLVGGMRNAVVAINGPVDVLPDGYGTAYLSYPLPVLVDPDSFTIWDGTSDGIVESGNYEDYLDAPGTTDPFPPLGLFVFEEEGPQAASFQPHHALWRVLAWDTNPDGSQVKNRVLVVPLERPGKWFYVNSGLATIPPYALVWSDYEGYAIDELNGLQYVGVFQTQNYSDNTSEYTASSDPGTIWFINGPTAINGWGQMTRDTPALVLLDQASTAAFFAEGAQEALEAALGPVVGSWGAGPKSFVNIFNPIGLSAANPNLAWITAELMNAGKSFSIAGNNSSSGTLASFTATTAALYQFFFSCSVECGAGATASFTTNLNVAPGNASSLFGSPAAQVSAPSGPYGGATGWEQVCFGGLANMGQGDVLNIALNVTGGSVQNANGLLWGSSITASTPT